MLRWGSRLCYETVSRRIFESPSVVNPLVTVMARTALDHNLFKTVVRRGDPVTAQELASITEAEEALVGRVTSCS